MAHPHLAATVAQFATRVHRSKNRLVAIPAVLQRELGLERQPDNCIALVSIRRAAGKGRWNHHYVKLTRDNEFAIPSDVVAIQPGNEIEVKIHRLIRDEPLHAVPVSPPSSAAGLLLQLAGEPRPSSGRTDGSEQVDRYLDEGIHGA